MSEINKEDIEEFVDKWRVIADQKMEEIDTQSPSYTGCTGALCMGVKLCLNDLEKLVEENE